MKRSFLWAAIAALALGGVATVQAQSGDPDRVDRQAALLNAASIENAFRSVERRIRVTDAGNLWADEWTGLVHPPSETWWLSSWTERGLTARYCEGVLAVYAATDELKGVGRDQRAVQVAPVVSGNGRSGLHLITRGSRLFRGAHGRQDGSLPGCMPVPSTTGDRVGLVLAVADPKLTATGLRWETEDRTVSCLAPDTGTMVERRRIPVQVTAVTDCPAAMPNCNDLRELAPAPPAWPADCATRATMLSASPPTLPANAACSDWARWRSNCQVVYAAAPPAADIPDPVITWETGPVHTWTSPCSCPSGQTGTCTEHWEQNTEIRVFVLRPGSPELRTRQPARGSAGRRRLVSTDENCTAIIVENDNPSDDNGGPDDGGNGGDSSTSEDSTSTSESTTSTSTDVPEQDTVSDPNFGGPTDPPSGNENGGGDGKPIILDLDGDGVELVPLEDSTAFYDINGDGYRTRMAWAAPDDGFLAYDKDDDGAISAPDELSFLSYVENSETDLEGLRHFDTDGDGTLDPDDEDWSLFRVWRDLDQDGESDPGELTGLDEAGIELISLTAETVKRRVAGNTVYGEGVYVGPEGPRAFWDVALRSGPRVE